MCFTLETNEKERKANRKREAHFSSYGRQWVLWNVLRNICTMFYWFLIRSRSRLEQEKKKFISIPRNRTFVCALPFVAIKGIKTRREPKIDFFHMQPLAAFLLQILIYLNGNFSSLFCLPFNFFPSLFLSIKNANKRRF